MKQTHLRVKAQGGKELIFCDTTTGVADVGILRGKCCLEPGFVDGLHVSLQSRDLSGEHLFPNRVVHELHPMFLSASDDVIEFLRGTFTDHGAYRRGGN